MRKVLSTVVAAFSLLGSVSAQYVSEGWKPGQVVSTNEARHADYDPSSASTSQSDTASNKEQTSSTFSIFDVSTYLESGPMKALFTRAGVNITEKLEAAREMAKIWDERVPLLDDSNYEDIVVEEQFESLEEEKDRIWFIAM